MSPLPGSLPIGVRAGLPPSRLSNSQYRATLLIVVGLASALIALTLKATGALNSFDSAAIDARFSLRGTERPDLRLALVAVDDATEKALNVGNPIPRGDVAKLLDRLHANGARLIVLDFQFKGTSLAPEQDRALVSAIGRDGPVLIGAPDPPNGVFHPAGRPPARGEELASLAVDNQNDAVVRQLLHTQVTRPTLAVRAAQLAGHPVSESDFPGNHAWIDFRGPPGTFPVQSVIKILNGSLPAALIRGKIVIVGTTDPLAKDVFVTAASSEPMPGLELQANALSTVLGGFPLRSASGFVGVLLLLLLAAAPSGLGWRLPSLYALAGSVLVVVVYLVGVQLAFNSGSVVPIADPLAALLLATGGVIAADTLVERRRRMALEYALKDFVRPGRYDFFISYRRDDTGFAATTLCNQLNERFGPETAFVDKRTILAGQLWPNEILEAIVGSAVMLVLIGHHWLGDVDASGRRRIDREDDWVRLEAEAGLKQPELVVVPVLVEGAAFPPEATLPESLKPLAHRHAIALSGDDTAGQIDQLVREIEIGRARELFSSGTGATSSA